MPSEKSSLKFEEAGNVHAGLIADNGWLAAVPPCVGFAGWFFGGMDSKPLFTPIKLIKDQNREMTFVINTTLSWRRLSANSYESDGSGLQI